MATLASAVQAWKALWRTGDSGEQSNIQSKVKPKRRSKKSKSRRQKKETLASFQQRTLEGQLLIDAECFGDPPTDKNNNVLRISFKNISSLPLSKTHYKNWQLLNFVRKRGINAYLMAEIGLHWPSVPQDQGWEERLFGHFRNMPKGIMACNTTKPQLSGSLQYGGTSTLITTRRDLVDGAGHCWRAKEALKSG